MRTAVLLLLSVLPAADPPPTAPAPKTEAVAPEAPAPPQRVWVVLDFYKEFGGTIVRENESTLVVRTLSGEERTVDRSLLISAVPLLDDPPGTPVTVHLRSGRRLSGKLITDGFENVTVEIGGSPVVMPRSKVWGLEREEPFRDTVTRIRSTIASDDWPSRLALARWALREGHPDVAAEELREILKHEDAPEIRRLLTLAESADRSRRTDADPATPDSGRPGRSPQPASGPKPLQPADVNLIRVMEVDLRRPPRLEASTDLPTELVTRYAAAGRLPTDGDTAEKLASWPATRLLTLLFQLKARDLYGRITVAEDPEHLRIFRREVHDRWLIPNCATSLCHGGEAGGSLRLARDRPRDAGTAYTNLLVLLKARTRSGEPLLDLEDPDRSTLLDMGRPAESAKRPHPAVAGWRPSVPGSKDELRTSVLRWLQGMHQPRPDYPLSEDPTAVQLPPAGTDER